MKKIILLIIPLFIWGCEKNYDNVIDPSNTSYQVTGVSSFSSREYRIGDSTVVFYLTVTQPSSVSGVHIDIYAPDGSKVNTSSLILYDQGLAVHGDAVKNDGTFSNKYPFSQSFLNGSYEVYYYVTSQEGAVKRAAVQKFLYNNGTANAAPVVSNLTAPDTAVIGSQSVLIFLSVDVADSNGYGDIAQVFFNSYIPPNGSASVSNPFIMYDNGTNGDVTAGDGTYSLVIQLPPQGVTKGVYRWEFMARDRGNKLSNKIIHNITIL